MGCGSALGLLLSWIIFLHHVSLGYASRMAERKELRQNHGLAIRLFAWKQDTVSFTRDTNVNGVNYDSPQGQAQ